MTPSDSRRPPSRASLGFLRQRRCEALVRSAPLLRELARPRPPALASHRAGSWSGPAIQRPVRQVCRAPGSSHGSQAVGARPSARRWNGEARGRLGALALRKPQSARDPDACRLSVHATLNCWIRLLVRRASARHGFPPAPAGIPEKAQCRANAARTPRPPCVRARNRQGHDHEHRSPTPQFTLLPGEAKVAGTTSRLFPFLCSAGESAIACSASSGRSWLVRGEPSYLPHRAPVEAEIPERAPPRVRRTMGKSAVFDRSCPDYRPSSEKPGIGDFPAWQAAGGSRDDLPRTSSLMAIPFVGT